MQLCAAGEVGGILDTILNRLAAYIEKNEKLKSKVKGAMVYPTIVIVVAVGVTAVLLLFSHAGVREDVRGLRRRAAGAHPVRHRHVGVRCSTTSST